MRYSGHSTTASIMTELPSVSRVDGGKPQQ